MDYNTLEHKIDKQHIFTGKSVYSDFFKEDYIMLTPNKLPKYIKQNKILHNIHITIWKEAWKECNVFHITAGTRYNPVKLWYRINNKMQVERYVFGECKPVKAKADKRPVNEKKMKNILKKNRDTCTCKIYKIYKCLKI